ncbi:MAG: WbqC family protein [Selenomonadaceae bacterium]|nr:WbqC family protein [Selenomonadaceae bacterium]
MKRVAVLQSNYIPWKGYFDIIHDVDEFIFHDDLQYTKNDWRNRNIILIPGTGGGLCALEEVAHHSCRDQ